MSDKIRVILFQDGPDHWIAQGLEHDIAVQAASMHDLYGRFEVAVYLENEHGGLDRIPAAPAKYFDLWDSKADTMELDDWTPDSFYEYRRLAATT